jgi:hypothetical protein
MTKDLKDEWLQGLIIESRLKKKKKKRGKGK